MDKTTLIRTGVAAGVAAVGLSLGGISLATADDASGTTDSRRGDASAAAATGDRGLGGHGPGAHGPFGRGPGGPGMDAAALAEQLGVSEAELSDAFEAVRDQLRPDDDGTDGRHTPPTEAERTALQKRLAAALADELGVSEAKVTAALDVVREQHQAEHRDELATRLDDAVEAGDLTAADKASVLKAYDAGVLGGPGGPRG